jgi:ABC-type Fe3+-hydroxamate transport system substrate-binding protein
MKLSDQLSRSVELLFFPPKRIISIVPSQTELLFDLGLQEEVIGITKFCVHPDEWFRNKKRVGGTKQLNLSLIRELHPDLIIANKEENSKEDIETLINEFPVWISDVKKLEDAYEMIEQVGKLVDRPEQSQELIARIKSNFTHQLPLNNGEKSSNVKPQTIYLIWKDPYMTVGGDTFINEMMNACGLQNVFENETRYPQVSISELSSAFAEASADKSVNCQLLLLSSEPYPFRQKHIEELQVLLPGTRILLVDGEMFSWYGSRLLHAPAYFSKLRELIFNR